MKSANSVLNYWQLDHRIRALQEQKGVRILPSPEAWKRLSWTKALFEKKPREGYFIWVKEQPREPLITCISIAKPRIAQNLTNLLVVEPGLKVKATVFCNSIGLELCARHKARGRIVLKQNSCLDYVHFHKWGRYDAVNPEYEFLLEKGAKLSYQYKNLFPPTKLKLATTVSLAEAASASLRFVINGLNTKAQIKDTVYLRGSNSSALVQLRLVGKQNSELEAISRVFAEAPGKAHLDCQGLLASERASISLVPQLINKNKKALITHEASIGRIAEEQLSYLRTRGLSEQEAIKLIVNGFLAS